MEKLKITELMKKTRIEILELLEKNEDSIVVYSICPKCESLVTTTYSKIEFEFHLFCHPFDEAVSLMENRFCDECFAPMKPTVDFLSDEMDKYVLEHYSQ
ncbi:MAG: hypothetical protein KGZ97_09785 [Bacteroidetes bacterium]|nr:hypothetical protein [Bacteroidota bacterium]